MKFTREERDRILAGDISPVLREDEPDCERGEKIVLKWSRKVSRVDHHQLEHEQRRAGERHLPADVVQKHISITPPTPLVIVTITGKRRRTKGGWSVSYDLADLRQSARMPRRVPPNRQHGDYIEKPLTETEIAKASEESNYTSSYRDAADHLDSPEPEHLNVIAMEARKRFAEHQRAEKAEETMRNDLRRINARMKAACIRAVRMGVDPTALLGRFERELAELEARSRDAA